jgi:phosphonate transport system permease protein
MEQSLRHESTLGVCPQREISRTNMRFLGGGLTVAVMLWALAQTGLLTQTLVNPGGWALVQQFLQAASQPELSPAFLSLTLNAALITSAYAICGASLSLGLGLVGGLLAAEAWWRAALPHRAVGQAPWLAMRALLVIPRSIHEVIWGLLFLNLLGLDPLTAILAIAIPFGAITAKVFAEILDETPQAPMEALLHSGASPLAAVVYGLLPAALPNLLSYAFYRLECAIRSAAVLGVIGAGGLGYEILLSFQALRYAQMWTFLWALIALTGLVDFASGVLRRRVGGRNRMQLVNHQLVQVAPGNGAPETLSKRSALTRAAPLPRLVWLSLLALVPLSAWYLRVDVRELFAPRVLRLLGEVAQAAFPPALDWPLLVDLGRLTLQTLALSILAMAFASLGGLLLAFPAADARALSEAYAPAWQRLLGAAGRLAARAFLLVCRAIPASVWALLCLFVLFPGLLPGAAALGLYTLGILGRLMAEVIEGLDARPLRALQALGASRLQVWGYGVLPRTLSHFVAYSLYRWEVCARETVVVGAVGAAGLGRILSEQMSNFDYRGVLTTLIFFIGLTLGVDFLSALLRRNLR